MYWETDGLGIYGLTATASLDVEGAANLGSTRRRAVLVVLEKMATRAAPPVKQCGCLLLVLSVTNHQFCICMFIRSRDWHGYRAMMSKGKALARAFTLYKREFDSSTHRRAVSM